MSEPRGHAEALRSSEFFCEDVKRQRHEIREAV